MASMDSGTHLAGTSTLVAGHLASPGGSLGNHCTDFAPAHAISPPAELLDDMKAPLVSGGAGGAGVGVGGGTDMAAVATTAAATATAATTTSAAAANVTAPGQAKQPSIMRHVALGAVANVIAANISHPLEVVKVRLQMAGMAAQAAKGVAPSAKPSAVAVPPAPATTAAAAPVASPPATAAPVTAVTNSQMANATSVALRGSTASSLGAAAAAPATAITPRVTMYSVARDLYKLEGPRSFFRGLSAAYMFQIVMNGVRLGMYDTVANTLYPPKPGDTSATTATQMPLLVTLVVSIGAGGLGSFLASPFYLIKTRQQAVFCPRSTPGAAGSFIHHTRALLFPPTYSAAPAPLSGTAGNHPALVPEQRPSLAVLTARAWKGSNVAAARTAVGSCSQLAGYGMMLRFLRSDSMAGFSPTPGSTGEITIAAASAACFTSIFMTPLDVVSTRLYAEKSSSAGASLMSRGLQIARTEGLAGLYSGAGALLVRTAPHTIAALVAWEWLKKVV
ncbi:hypothetical protein H696_04340 [Fonticula alba]|uniref:Mitochondrial carrier protein n=1 Tax=Fonticula alba TaxID=691883 RepID=A0A058Z3U1_FONAL|nr:hypothetical protein H696_04340 [Fonticula alba]KCV68920.1 hypothetical protein H696_04340 [Fonticula alba]|eukprot:XP_009496491.1 hypothetical protein H696_04340 [Fonticula alba]